MLTGQVIIINFADGKIGLERLSYLAKVLGNGNSILLTTNKGNFFVLLYSTSHLGFPNCILREKFG